MEKGFTNRIQAAPGSTRRQRISCTGLLAGFGLFVIGAGPLWAQEQVLFPAIHNAQAAIVQRINAEQVRLDVATWYLNDGDIAIAIRNKHLSGVPVRVIGDRGAIFEADPNTRAWFEYLANSGVPIRLRYHPTWFPEIIHWKCGIFVGQQTVEFGSANWTTFELAPWSATNFKDESAMFTNDPPLVNAFLTKFDQMWADTTNFLDWPEAYRAETGQTWTPPMTIDRARLEPDYPTNVPGMVWSQGTELTNVMLSEINRETQAIDVIVYRLTIPSITDALIQRHQAGVSVRVFVEQTQYRNLLYPEYELTGANMDRLWAAGIPIRQRVHDGLIHMKSLITSNVALVASSNFTKNWERDHNYFIPVATKPTLHAAMKGRFNAMWNDTTNYATFQTQNPGAATLMAPAAEAFDVSTTIRFDWRRANWATAFDVYIGTSPGNMSFAGRVDAVLNETPPQTYSFTPTTPLQPSTRYWWKVVSRTYATDVNPARIASSEIWSFTTSAGGGGGGSGPCCGPPVALPGTIQAENFDSGGQSVAYNDTSSGNSGGEYRNTDVDLATATDAGGGYCVGWIAPGEWLKYSVNVGAAGSYTLEFRVASSGGGGTFHIEANGANLTGPVQIPNTGGWQSWTTVTKTNVNLTAGQQVWTVIFDAVGTGGVIGNLNYIRVAGGAPGPPPIAPIPGTLQAEDFDSGGEGVAYHDNSPGNEGGQYRVTDVDIVATSDAGGGYIVGWAFAGEWLRYTVNVGTAGTYDIEVRVASAGNGGTFHIAVNGVDKTGPFTVPNTGGWDTWTTIRKTGITLSAGQQVWQLVMDTNGPTTAVGNFNYIRVLTAGGPPPPPPPPPAPEIVIYGADVPNANLQGNWAKVSDATAAAGLKVLSTDLGAATVGAPAASPTTNYFDVTFTAQAGVRYRLWLRMSAMANDKFNDSVWVQFSGSNDAAGSPRYRIGTAQGLNVNLATCGTCAPAGWGWQNHAYWEADTGEIWFASSGTQTIRVQIREDGVAIDQIILSPQVHVDLAPGPPALDATIVPKP